MMAMMAMMMMTRICRHHDRSPGGVQTHVPEDLALQACDSLETHSGFMSLFVFLPCSSRRSENIRVGALNRRIKLNIFWNLSIAFIRYIDEVAEFYLSEYQSFYQSLYKSFYQSFYRIYKVGEFYSHRADLASVGKANRST